MPDDFDLWKKMQDAERAAEAARRAARAQERKTDNARREANDRTKDYKRAQDRWRTNPTDANWKKLQKAFERARDAWRRLDRESSDLGRKRDRAHDLEREAEDARKKFWDRARELQRRPRPRVVA